MDVMEKLGMGARLKGEEEIFFVQQLALMLKVNISIPNGLEFLSRQEKDPRRKKIFQSLRDSVTEGNSFEASMREHPKFFSPVFIDLINLGELRGDLPLVLDSYKNLLRSRLAIRKKFRKALTYPIIVVLAAVAMVVAASVFIFPEIQRLFSEINLELPLVTRVILAITEFMNAFGVYIFGGLGIATVALVIFFGSKQGRPVYHRMQLGLPLVRRIVREKNISQTMRYIAVLIHSGMPIIEVLESVGAMTSNIPYRRSIEDARDGVEKGNRLSDILRDYPNLYPMVAVELVAVGEETGSFEEVTAEISTFYEDRLFALLESLPSIIEPMLIFVIGAMVAFIALSVLLPMYSLASSI